MRLLMIALACLLAALPAAAEGQQPIRGGYAVLHDSADAHLRELKTHGLNLVILQYTQSDTGAPEIQKALQFVDSAEAAGIGYMVGLYYHGSWDQDSLLHRLDEFVGKSLALMDVLGDSLDHRTTRGFKGWYMPLEVANLDDFDYQALARAFAPFATASSIPIAMSVYFNPQRDFLRPASFAAAIAPVLALFDIVLMQDGVGERRVTDAELHNYYTALRNVVPPSGRFWAVVEGFKCTRPNRRERTCPEGDPRPPADGGRMCTQVRNVRPLSDGIIAYNLIEVLHPAGDPQQKRVYGEYIKAVSGQRCP